MKFVGILTLLLLIDARPGFAQNTPSTSTSEIIYLSQEENQFYVLLNQFRSELGLSPVKIHVALQNAAKKHSEWMVDQNFLSHYGDQKKTPYQRMTEEGYVKYTIMGENVACGNGDAVKTFRQWALSPGHLANMINPHFRHIGISRAGTGNEKCPYYWTNDFGSMADTRLDPPAITDLAQITSAIETLSGMLTDDEKVELPQETPAAPTATPKPVAESTDFSVIQCMIPYSLSRNVLSFISNTDALIEITRSSNNGYQVKTSYLQNGATTDYLPLTINNVSVIKNPTYPLFIVFSAPGYRTGGFTIQFDAKTNKAQFDTYPASSSASGSIICSYK